MDAGAGVRRFTSESPAMQVGPPCTRLGQVVGKAVGVLVGPQGRVELEESGVGAEHASGCHRGTERDAGDRLEEALHTRCEAAEQCGGLREIDSVVMSLSFFGARMSLPASAMPVRLTSSASRSDCLSRRVFPSTVRLSTVRTRSGAASA